MNSRLPKTARPLALLLCGLLALPAPAALAQTPDAIFTLLLIHVRLVPPTIAQAHTQTSDDAKQASLTNLKHIGLGMVEYVQDWDEKFPPMQSTAIAKKALSPYIKNTAVFQNPTTHEPYRPNTSLSHHSLAEIKTPNQCVFYFENSSNLDGTRGVLFADGHAAYVTDAEWRRLLAASHLPPPAKGH